MKHYFVKFSDVRPRSEWDDREQAIFKAHIAYLDNAESDGSLRYAGLAKLPGADELAYGFAVYVAEDHERAQLLVEEDPGVRDGILTADWHRLDRFFGKAP